MAIVEQWWRRAAVTNPALDPTSLLVLALVALVGVMVAWPAVRMALTLCHEGGHALAATLTGRSLRGIRLHSDTSGVTITRGRPTGPGMVVTLLSGYPAPSLIGLLAAGLAGAGHAVGMLWLLVGLLAAMLLQIRNLYGSLVVLGLGVALALATWSAPAQLLVWLAYALAWLLLLAGPRPVLELALSRHGAAVGSDAAQLARLTRLPRAVWISLWLATTLGALLGGALMMLPGLLSRI